MEGRHINPPAHAQRTQTPPARMIAILLRTLSFLIAVGLPAWIFPPAASAENDRFIFNMMACCSIGGMTSSPGGPLTTADTVTGANQFNLGITLPGQSAFALSPDGQLVAYSKPVKGVIVVSIARSDGWNPQPIRENVQLLSFAPSGTELLVGNSLSESSPCPGVCLMSLDGSTLTTLTTATRYATMSPDGTALAWDALGTTSKTKKSRQLFVLKLGESKPKQITNFESKTTPVGVFAGETFGPGNKLAFWGEPLATNELWTINADGTGLAKVPIGSGNLWFGWTPGGQLNVTKHSGKECGIYTVNPNGTEYTRVPVSEASSCEKYPGFETGAIPTAAYRQPSTLVDHSDYLAGQFEPVLRFDSLEQWRPLNLDSFFEEEPRHFACSEPLSCSSITSPDQLNKFNGPEAYLNIAGKWEESGDEVNYHSPYEECTSEGLRDCDAGPRSAIYWRSAGEFEGYEYIDYWVFYRANYFYEGFDFHEGDWEGVTVAPSLTEGTFDYAAFSQHGPFYSYLRDVLRCEDSPSEAIPEGGTCGTEESHDGRRVVAMVANGSHANYTTPCSESAPPPGDCSQNGSYAVERGYDGEVRWGRAFDYATTSLYEMPPSEETSWQYWHGFWGFEVGSFAEYGPESPGLQSVKMSMECASIDNGSGTCDGGPRASSATASGQVPASNFGNRSPGLSAVSCGAWAGQGIGAVACNPRELRRSVRSGAVGRQEDLHIAVVGGGGDSASGRGISQYANGGVVRRGARLRLNGRLTTSTVVILKVHGPRRGRVSSWRVRPVRTGSTASASRSKGRTFRVRLKPGPRGEPRLYLGRFKARLISSTPK
jgi:hypothetical protein